MVCETIEEADVLRKENPAEDIRVGHEIMVQKWLCWHMEKIGGTIGQYIRAVVESKIRD